MTSLATSSTLPTIHAPIISGPEVPVQTSTCDNCEKMQSYLDVILIQLAARVVVWELRTGNFDHNGKIDLHVTNYWNEASDVYLQRTTGLFRASWS